MSENILLIIIAILFIILIIELIIIQFKSSNLPIRLPSKIEFTEYDEEKIMTHLSYIVDEAIAEYYIYHIHPTNAYYINKKAENDMIEFLKNTIPERLSSTLLNNLQFIYNIDYIGTFIGNYIYNKVTEYVIEFNIENQRTDGFNLTEKNK